MRQVSLQNKKDGILWCLSFALILGALMLGACIQPVSIAEFLQNPEVVSVVTGGSGGGGGGNQGDNPKLVIITDPPKDPVLRPDPTTAIGSADDPIVVSSTPITIYVSNIGNVNFKPGSIQWYCDSTTAMGTGFYGTNNEYFTVNRANAPFNVPGLYQLSVVWIIETGLEDKLYHGDIYIKVP